MTDDPRYDAAMNALHDATSEAHAWDISWAPDHIREPIHRMMSILGAAILAAVAQRDEWMSRAENAAFPRSPLNEVEKALLRDRDILRAELATVTAERDEANTALRGIASCDVCVVCRDCAQRALAARR